MGPQSHQVWVVNLAYSIKQEFPYMSGPQIQIQIQS